MTIFAHNFALFIQDEQYFELDEKFVYLLNAPFSLKNFNNPFFLFQ
jgi:hypothetical protein